MGKQLVYICDGKGCGHVLVNPDDGFVVQGIIGNTGITDSQSKTIIDPFTDAPKVTEGEAQTVVYCRDCMAEKLGYVAVTTPAKT